MSLFPQKTLCRRPRLWEENAENTKAGDSRRLFILLCLLFLMASSLFALVRLLIREPVTASAGTPPV